MDATFDHTSILQLLAEKFAGGPHGFSAEVNDRMFNGVQNRSLALTLDAPRVDVLLPPAGPTVATTHVRSGQKRGHTENQRAFEFAARWCLDHSRKRALAHFPELAMLREERPQKGLDRVVPGRCVRRLGLEGVFPDTG